LASAAPTCGRTLSRSTTAFIQVVVDMQPLNDLIDLGLNPRNSRRKRSVDGAIPANRIIRVNKRDSIYLVNVTGRATGPERASIDTLRDLQLTGVGGQSVPLGAVATLRYEIEQPTIWRRSRIPTITLKASTLDTVQPKTVVDQLAPKVDAGWILGQWRRS
jgi:Cu/Ag efflux pump CusA